MLRVPAVFMPPCLALSGRFSSSLLGFLCICSAWDDSRYNLSTMVLLPSHVFNFVEAFSCNRNVELTLTKVSMANPYMYTCPCTQIHIIHKPTYINAYIFHIYANTHLCTHIHTHTSILVAAPGVWSTLWEAFENLLRIWLYIFKDTPAISTLI